MNRTSKCPCFFGAAVLMALALIVTPAFAGDGCCGEEEIGNPPVAAATPQDCFAALFKGMCAADKDAIWGQLSEASQKAVEKKGDEMKEEVAKNEEAQKELGLTAEEAKAISGRDLMLTAMIVEVKAMMAKKAEGGCCPGDEKAGEETKEPSCEIKDVRIDGDKATATCPMGMALTFVKEKDAWKMDIAAMLEKHEGCDEEGGGCCGEGEE
ncbi:MAG: hypothetical protein HYY18_01710 [Planctomycetes bacterium]|nr:hypothetical protein [Planctomycetota bacterium]